MRLLLACLLLAIPAAQAEEDRRAWQHGIDIVRIDGRLLVVWGSAGIAPRPNPGGDWQHDIYYAWADAPDLPLQPRLLVARPEAQEPPSTAVNSRGTILVTSEDGHRRINQYAGLWTSALRVRHKYQLLRRGGHSGHAAAMGERFLVAYGEGWVNGGAWNDLGTGANLHARILADDGRRGREILISSGHRDSWPLVAGSDRNWLVVWQRYPGLTLHAALIGKTGTVTRKNRIIDGLPLRYAYDVAFSPQLASYVVAGSSGDGGFAALLDRSGELKHLQRGLPPMASESRIVLGLEGGAPIGVYPVKPRGVAVVRLSPGAVSLARVVDHPHDWDYMGTAGVFTAPGQVLFATLTTAGMKLVPVTLHP